MNDGRVIERWRELTEWLKRHECHHAHSVDCVDEWIAAHPMNPAPEAR